MARAPGTIRKRGHLGLDPVLVGPLSRAKEFDRGTSIWETGASAQAIREALGLR